MAVRKYFMSYTHICPSDMEYALEEMASKGLMLQPFGEMGMFYFVFLEKDPVKCKYVVDISSLPKSMYMDTLISKGWEFLGKTGNCYVWRQTYDDERPEDFSDKACLYKHCSRMAFAFLGMAFVCIALMLGLIWGVYYENHMGVNTHIVMYIIESILQIPLIGLLGYAGVKLFKGRDRYR